MRALRLTPFFGRCAKARQQDRPRRLAESFYQKEFKSIEAVDSKTDKSNRGRQSSLRNADWRFLLPEPAEGVFQHLVLLGATADLAERILEVGLAHRVSREMPRERSADAVIVFHNAHASINDVADCLLPGGNLYLEVDRRHLRSAALTPGRTRRALQNAGLSPTASYVVSPDFARRRVYLPLDVPEAVSWYLRSFFIAATPARRLLEPALHAVIRLGVLASLVPCYAITATAGRARHVPPSVLGHPALPPELRCSNLHALVLTPGDDDLNRVVMLPVSQARTRPLGVLKLSRLPARNILSEEEQISLTTIRTKLDDAMRRTIPQPLGTLHWGQLSVEIESCAPGNSLATSSGRWRAPLRRKIDDLQRAVAWLTEFHRQAQFECSLWGSSESREWVEIPLADYERAFGVTAAEERLFAAVRRRADTLMGSVLPTVLVHWNFSMSHLFRAEREITVVDWEGVVPGPALLDLLFFVMRWAYTVRQLGDDDAQLRGFRDLFCDSKQSDPISAAAHQAISRYMTRLGIDYRFLPLMLVIMCVVRALGRFNRRNGGDGRGESARAGNQYARYIDILTRNVERLFTELDGKQQRWSDCSPS